jgi:hypothetical protein
MMFRKLLPLALVAGLVSNIFATPAKSAENLRADVINVYFDPDFPLPAGQSLLTHYQSKKYVYLYREIIPVEVGGNTYFAMLGANGGYPDFYGGIQYFEDGSKAAIFSAWDVGADGACSACLPGTAAPEKQVSVWAKGPRTVTRPFGYEGTGMNSMIYGFDWKLNQKVGMLASIEPAGTGSLISAAFKNGNEPWEFMTSFYVPTRYDMGMTGGYSFLEDWTGGAENTARSYLVGPSYLEDEDGKGAYLTNVYVGVHNPTGTKIPNKHSIAVENSWLRVRSGISTQASAKPEYRIQLQKPAQFPDINEGKALLESKTTGKSTRYQEKLKRLQDAMAAKAAADLLAKAEAEAKAKLEAIAKAEAEAKAKLEAIAKAEAEALAKLEAEAKAKLEALAKLEAEVKAKSDAKALAAKLAASKKITIICIKGKTIKKVTGIKPKCPSGFKKK